jgi:hypothetical protein
MKAILFLEFVLKHATKPDDVEYFTNLLFELKKEVDLNEQQSN